MRTIPLSLLSLVLLSCIALPRPPIGEHSPFSPLPQPAHVVYLPHMSNVLPTATPRPTATPTPSPCFRTPQAAQFAALLVGDSRQQRTSLTCSPALVEAAQRRAESMAYRGYFGHCDPDGICANDVVRASGCRLPASYPARANSVESLIAGSPDVALLWEILGNSPAHAAHLLGTVEFFRQQDRVGVAFVEVAGSRYRYYTVVIVAQCE